MSSPNTAKEHYNLRWNNYFNNLVQVFSECKHKEQLVDVTLLCEGFQIKAHKIILAACSGFFMDLFLNMVDIHPVIMLYEIKYSNLKQIIQFIYQGEVKVLDIDLEGVLSLGEKFQVKGLSSVKLKHKVSPAGEDSTLEEESIKYKIVSKNVYTNFQQKEETAAADSINANTSKDETLHSSVTINEPIQKKIKMDPIIIRSPNVQKSASTSKEDNQHKTSKWKMCTNISDNQPVENNSLVTSSQTQSDKISPQTKKHGSGFIILNRRVSEPKSLNKESATFQKTQDISEQNVSNETSSDSSDKPINAFIIFSKEWRKKLRVEHPDEDFKSISVRLGNLWKSLTSETRECYYMAARQAQLGYQQSKSEL